MICSALATATGWLLAGALGGGAGAVWAGGRARRAPTGLPTAAELQRLRADLEAAETEAANRQAEVTTLRRRLAEHRPGAGLDPPHGAVRPSRRVQPPRPPAVNATATATAVHATGTGAARTSSPTAAAQAPTGQAVQLARRRAGGVANGP